jgi:phospholipase/carboxylesterase
MGGPPDIAAILSTRDKLRIFLDECVARYPIDPKKLIVLGFSQGGVMAYSLALENPERFAAVAVLSSWLPKELAAMLSIGDGAKSLPVLVQHGSQDQLIEVARARDSVEALRGLKIPVTYREYEMGHEITPKSLADLSAWLEEALLSRTKARDF